MFSKLTLLMTSAKCLKQVTTDIDEVPPTTITTTEDILKEPTGVNQFTAQGPLLGVCSAVSNSHPLAFSPEDKEVVGEYKTMLVDAEMLNRSYTPQCMTSEFF